MIASDPAARLKLLRGLSNPGGGMQHDHDPDANVEFGRLQPLADDYVVLDDMAGAPPL